MSVDFLRASNDNFQETWQTIASHYPAGEVRQFGPLSAISAGIASPMYNRIFVFDPPNRDDLGAAIRWLTGREIPFGVFVEDSVIDTVEEYADDVGIERMDVSFPGMVHSTVADIPSNEADVEIVAVGTDADFDAFCDVLRGIPEFPTDVNTVMPSSVRTDESIRLFVGRVAGQPAVCGWLALVGTSAGVYAIGVAETYRRQGLGDAMTRTILRAGHEAGSGIGVLQSSPMAVPLYERLGFDTVTTYHIFTSGH